MVSDPLRVALRVAEIFESLGIRYLIGGAFASAILGEPRATEDIDGDRDLVVQNQILDAGSTASRPVAETST